jgi:very-short-patch-repair endonuclease
VSDNSRPSNQGGVPGDPLLQGAVVNAGKFAIRLDAERYFYPAASHRSIVKKLYVENIGWSGEEEIVVTVFTEAFGANSFVFPIAKAFPPIAMGQAISVDINGIRPNFKELALLEESVVGNLVVQVSISGAIIAEERRPIEFLAFNQWMHDKYDYECLSAFVFPNHPLVSQIMDGVRQRLKDMTGNGFTDGYQLFSRDPGTQVERNLFVLKAIYEELQSMNLEYSDPPQSFEGYGQKIRTPDIILRDKAATCLDSSVLIASCIGAAGLSPLVFVVHGHAFPGVWSTPFNVVNGNSKPGYSLTPPAIIDNVNTFQSLSELGMILSLESTQICKSLAEPFDVAVNRHKDFAHGAGAGKFLSIVDVARSREVGVRGLPNRIPILGTQEFDVEVDRSAFEVVLPDSISTIDSDDAVDRAKYNDGKIPSRMRKWMDALLDVSNSNPLINIASDGVTLPQKGARNSKSIQVPMVPGLLHELEDRLISGETIRVACVHKMPTHVLQNSDDQTIIENFKSTGMLPIAPIGLLFQAVEQLIEVGESQGLPHNQARVRAQQAFEVMHEQEATKRFRALKKLADDIEADSATNQLFLTVGTLVWTSPGVNGGAPKDVRSPLFVVPVRLSGNATSGFVVSLDADGVITPNYCLVEKLRAELSLQIPDLETPDSDEFGIDINRTISVIRRQLSESRYSNIRVDEEAQLAVLDFATFRVWQDLKSNWKLFASNPVVNHLVHGTNATLEQDLIPFNDELLTPFSCDESQMEAVEWALDGKSFVLEGPPGTGKSQTIANLIAASMAAGKRVLFVAEKQVALEAVSRKLEEIGLDPFCITMHHETTTPDSIRQQLRISLDFEGEDVSHQWTSESTVVKSLREKLTAYRDLLVRENDLRYNSLTSQQEVLRRGDGDAIMIPPAAFAALGPVLSEIESALLNIQGVVGGSRVSTDPRWTLATIQSIDSFDRDLFARVVSQVDDAVTGNSQLHPLLEFLLDSPFSTGVPTAVADVIGLVADGQALSDPACQQILGGLWEREIEDILGQISSARVSYADVFDFFTTAAFGLDLTPQMNAASEAISANLFSRGRKKEILRNLLQPIAKGSLEKEPTELLTLIQKISPVKARLEELTSSLRNVQHLAIRPDLDVLNDQHLAEIRATLAETKARAQKMSAPEAHIVRELYARGVVLQRTDIQTIDLVLASWGHVKTLLQVTAESVALWRQDRSVSASLLDSMSYWKEAAPTYSYLAKVALINQTLEPLRRGGLVDLEKAILSGDESLEDIHGRFMRGLAVSAREECLNTGVLSTFDSPTFDKAVADFVRRDEFRRELMWKVIPRQLSESRPFRPGVRTGEIGNLERELSMQRKRVSVASLIKTYGEIITQLAPCFLMSPEAVSRLLPAESQFFDMVVFDEASQIRVASAIPAMGRAKASIIVGDSQQMPPSQVIGKRQVQAEGGDDLDEQPNSKDLESILSECKESHIPSLMLKCHFRSQHEGLIAFSNRNFYEGSLVTFPAPNTDATTPVSWFEVPNGEFLRSGAGKGTNPEEAKAIVNEIIRRLEDPQHAGKSIGVVTFNEAQANHIQELLDNEAASHQALLMALQNPKKDEKLFVVPLERVQGDERDTIILSVSYSYQGGNRTTVSPTWGPLTHKGGERRLNVAITRSKKDLLVFCSFNPNHVAYEGSKHKGVPYTVEFLKECRDAAMTNGAALKARDVSAADLHRKKLFDLLRNNGIQVRENVGLSKFRIDLAVTDSKHGEQFLAILLDGELWSKRSTPFDRDVLPNNVLKLIGWRRVGRIWLKSVVDDPTRVLTLVQNEIAREQYRHELMALLRESGFEVRSDSRLSQVGLDIAIREPGQSLWPLAISLNGPELFRQYMSYEGDVPPESMLRGVQCIDGVSLWLPDVKDNPEVAMDRIKQFFDRAKQLMATVEAEIQDSFTAPRKVDELIKAAAEAADAEPLLLGSPMRQEFVDSKALPILGDQSTLGPGAGENLALVKRAADEIVEREGPITEDRLARVLAGRFGMARVTASRRDSLKKQFAHMTKSQTPFDTVYWSSTRQPGIWKGFRTSTDDSSRNIDDVPAEEIANAMVAVVALGNSCYREEIIKSVAEVYGRKAVTRTLNERLGLILDWTIEQSRLIVDGELYKLPS